MLSPWSEWSCVFSRLRWLAWIYSSTSVPCQPSDRSSQSAWAVSLAAFPLWSRPLMSAVLPVSTDCPASSSFIGLAILKLLAKVAWEGRVNTLTWLWSLNSAWDVWDMMCMSINQKMHPQTQNILKRQSTLSWPHGFALHELYWQWIKSTAWSNICIWKPLPDLVCQIPGLRCL